MLTLSPNSKRCSVVKNLVLSAATLAFSTVALASTQPVRESQVVLIRSLRSEIQTRSSNNFDSLLRRWEKLYGTQAVQPLLSLAQNRALADHERYIALMGAAKLGGKATGANMVPLLADQSWMIRNGALRALTAIRASEASSAALRLLRDPALVVRLEAVDVLAQLKPAGSEAALLEALQSRANYHGGRAQWVPQRALAALVKLNRENPTRFPNPELARKLRPLLDHTSDPALQAKTVETLEALTRQSLKPGHPLPARIQAWKLALRSS